MIPLTPVNSLTINILVDNCIEWMTKLPPGFSHEIRQQLGDTPPIGEETGVPIVDLEHYCCGAHGFSALITTEVEGQGSQTILFDTGPDSKTIIRNIEALKVPVHSIERVVISHWHADHTGGLLSFLDYRGSRTSNSPDMPISIDLHPDRPVARGIAPPPSYDNVIGRLPADPTFGAIEKSLTRERTADVRGRIELHSEGHVIANKTAYVSGLIPRVSDFEGGLLGSVRWTETADGAWKWIAEEHILDERYVAVDVIGKGLILFSACSHAGICNVVRDAVENFKRPIHMIVGGLHLAGPELASRIPKTVQFLTESLRPAPVYVLPMHCSGFAVKIALEHALGEGCVPAGVGTKIVVQGDALAETKIFEPSIL
ncbi:hypothetical protein SISNIDRAFT_472261 [Sistotremastrum niveocremeum HHB9708]|uniref:Metallo-beta-lactamase domain-containing protein n=1 Tax=Sistotremastrum niveocremeum HHB9708 TaxID=1314777 RepID=A0A164ZYF3_9AGAM|nr:hypothetical protein SISNIDRAFT_472261 [Sistotremastrum niveocremeum HHB9708]